MVPISAKSLGCFLFLVTAYYLRVPIRTLNQCYQLNPYKIFQWIYYFSLKKIGLKMLSAKCWSFCSGFNVLFPRYFHRNIITLSHYINRNQAERHLLNPAVIYWYSLYRQYFFININQAFRVKSTLNPTHQSILTGVFYWFHRFNIYGRMWYHHCV